MPKTIQLEAQTRSRRGSANARRLRRQGLLPGVVCNPKGEAQSIQLQYHGFSELLRHHRGENLIIDLLVEGAPARKVLMREVQHDPVDDRLKHVDFVEISMTRKMRVRIPVVFSGEPVGVSQEGGILEHVLRELEVECLPADLADSILVDVSALKLGGALLVRELTIDPKLRVITLPDQAVAIVSAPKEEEVVAAVAEAAAAEPEVIGKEKKEGEEAEGGEEGEAKTKGAPGKEAAGAKAAPAGKEGAKAPVGKDGAKAPAVKDAAAAKGKGKEPAAEEGRKKK